MHAKIHKTLASTIIKNKTMSYLRSDEWNYKWNYKKYMEIWIYKCKYNFYMEI